MDGTVRRIGDQLRVSVQLIEANSLGTLWSGSFEENIDDVFKIQSRVARQVAGELHASLTAEEQERLEERPTDNPEAYRLYMLGREYLSRPSGVEENIRTAEKYFTQSLDLDPSFAQAWGMLAVTYNWIYWFQGRRSDDLQKMEEAAEWALFYGPNLAETYLANGVFLFWDRSNQEQTLAHFETALEYYPNHSLLHLMTAYTHRSLGNWEKLIKHLEKALALDPLSTGIHTELAYDHWMLRNYDRAETYIDRLMDLKPHETMGLYYKAWIGVSKDGTLDNFEYWWDQIRPSDPAIVQPQWWGEYNTLKGDWNEALRGFRNIENDVAEEFEPNYTTKKYLIAMTLDAQGNRPEAMNLYREVRNELEALRDNQPEMARYRMSLAKVHSRMGEHEKAIHEAEIASELLDPLRQDAEDHPIIEAHLAEVYAWSGREKLAIDKLEFALSVPSQVHRNDLRIDPKWDPLRNNPRFQELIAGEDEPYIEGL
jgi:serine/threonine-protein kinase